MPPWYSWLFSQNTSSRAVDDRIHARILSSSLQHNTAAHSFVITKHRHHHQHGNYDEDLERPYSHETKVITSIIIVEGVVPIQMVQRPHPGVKISSPPLQTRNPTQFHTIRIFISKPFHLFYINFVHLFRLLPIEIIKF